MRQECVRQDFLQGRSYSEGTRDHASRGHTKQSQGHRLVPSPSPACSGWAVLEASVSSSALWVEPHPLQGPGEAWPWSHSESFLPCTGPGPCMGFAPSFSDARSAWLSQSRDSRFTAPAPLQTPPAPAPTRRSRPGVLVLLCLAYPSCCTLQDFPCEYRAHSIVCMDHILCVQPSVWERLGCFRVWLL